MMSIVFISDLHLSKECETLNQQFDYFIENLATDYKTVFILGDFFNVWVGDDQLNEWSYAIAKKLASLDNKGIKVKLMHGNRDFLLGNRFAQVAKCELISDPHVLTCDGQAIVLSHGDDLCTLDKSHQRFRRLTRSRLFQVLFLKLPLALRLKIAQKMRIKSQSGGKKRKIVDVVRQSVTERLLVCQSNTIIHGHTHKPQIQYYTYNNKVFRRIVLNDWDDKTAILCYDSTNGFHMRQCP
jgi:UDP-2,3-diacylglucosamine hydrolase